MRTLTNVNPLVTRFMVPTMPETVSESEVKIIYDPQKQTTFYMGGRQGPTRSYDGYKKTREKLPGSTYEHNDAERWTDD